MGLANIKMAAATAAASKETLTLSANTTTEQYSTSTTNNAFYALDEFATTSSYSVPYKDGTRNTSSLACYFIVNPTKSYTFGTSYKYSDSNPYRQWNDITVSSTSNTVASGKYKEIPTTVPKFKNLGRLYGYTGECQTYTPILSEKKYQMECWGAAGGRGVHTGGVGGSYPCGGYTSGNIILTSYTPLYVYVGQRGNDAIVDGQAAGGWNGGGNGEWDNSDDESCGAGGGATDIRLTKASETDNNVWYGFESMKSRIMVAGAAGGNGALANSFGGHGGNILGGLPGRNSNYFSDDIQSSQTSGYKFGYGENGYILPQNYPRAGGGGGYWGGRTPEVNGGWNGMWEHPAYGGSSYISGYSGCVAVKSGTSDDDITFRTETNEVTKASHISGYVFISDSMSMIDGDTSGMPNPENASLTAETMTGNNGNGYARITCTPYD